MKVHLLSGWLGSGKTTAIREACRYLQGRGRRVGVITNDQGIRLVDGGFFRGLGIPSRQVVGGCFCCHYMDLDDSISSLQSSDRPEIIFAESVGSCTDIIATVMNPLLRFRADLRPTFSVFADARLLRMMLVGGGSGFDPSVRYIYFKQLEEAGIIVVTKVDMMDANELEELKEVAGWRYAGKKILWQNSFDAGDVVRWMDVLDAEEYCDAMAAPEVDYTIYGAGEAMLAWLDQELEIVGGELAGDDVAEKLAADIYGRIVNAGYPIGHLKFLVNGTEKISYTGVNEGAVKLKMKKTDGRVQLLVNARVQVEPAILSALVADAIEGLQREHGCVIATMSVSSFQPGFPVPTHRLAD